MSISRSPVEAGRNGTGIRDGVNKRAGDEFNGGVGGVDGSKEVNIDEMVDDAGAELERAASGERKSVVGRVGVERKGSKDGRRGRVAREEFRSRKGTDIVGAETGSEGNAKRSRIPSGYMIDQRERFNGWEIGVKDVKRSVGSRWSGVMQSGDRMGDGARKEEIAGEHGDRGRQRKAGGVDLVESRKDVVAKTGREKAGSRETGHRRREQANLTETEADPATRMDSVTVKSRSSGSHVKLPGQATPTGSEVRKIGATREVGG